MTLLLMLVNDQEVQFGAVLRLCIAVYAQTIEFICQHLLCAQAATKIIRQVFSFRYTRIVKVIIRKEGTVMAVGAVAICVGLAVLVLLYVGFCASVELLQSRRMSRLARAAWFERQARIHRETGS